MSTKPIDLFGARAMLDTAGGRVAVYRLSRLAELGIADLERLPYALRVWLEGLLREGDDPAAEGHVLTLVRWETAAPEVHELPFRPARVLLQDFTGVPAVVDLAGMRSAMQRLGGDPRLVNPRVPVDLVIDHSVQVDRFGTNAALAYNVDLEFQRNRERYAFLRWAQDSFDNFRVVPPATGIVHQVNLEYLATVVTRLQEPGGGWPAIPDTLVGTDSHTTMINGLGVMGWGVGGIEAEAAMLGEPITMLPPKVVGFELRGALPPGSTATDLVLTVTQMLRRADVVGKFVEFYGAGLSSLSLPDRATIANMAPEYGATMGFSPVDAETLRYLIATGRSPEQVDLVERYTKVQGLFRSEGAPTPAYSSILTLDLGTVEPSLAGPKRPQDRVPLGQAKDSFRAALRAPLAERGYALSEDDLARSAAVPGGGGQPAAEITHGAVVIAAITSCTNTSNPSVMVAAGLVAKKAVERGLRVPPYVKTSLAPGSTVVTRYLEKAGLTPYLDALGFNLVGYGCTTCIGNSGPLPDAVARAVEEGDLVAAAVLSGNRNFEGRINPHVRANYLASPPLVVAYALAGTVNVDLLSEPLGRGSDGSPVYLRELWPTPEEVQKVVAATLGAEMFRQQYQTVFSGNEAWNSILPVSGTGRPEPDTALLYPWDATSTYIQEPPFFSALPGPALPAGGIRGARVLALLGDSVTTDHISPAGSIPTASPAGRYLLAHGVACQEFNSYGSRRGNHEVMIRGTFANIRLKNLLVPGTEGGGTLHLPSGEPMSIYDAAMRYQAEGTPLIVLAGREYGTGSSRDWAAKGTVLLGVGAVIAQSYERIHRSNLVGIGVLPLQFLPGEGAEMLGLTGRELFDITGLGPDPEPGREVQVAASRPDGSRVAFRAVVRLDTPAEVEYYQEGGTLQAVLRRLAAS